MSGILGIAAAAHTFPPIRSGGIVYAPEYSNGVFASNVAMAADLLYALPLFIANQNRVPVRGMQILAGTAVASCLGRMMLFSADGNGEPDALVATTTADVDMNNGSATVLSADFEDDITLDGGLYYPAVVFSGLAQPYSFATTAVSGNGIPLRLGVTDLRGIVAAGNGQRIYSRITGSFTFGDTPPAFFPTATYGTNTPGSPLLGVVTR